MERTGTETIARRYPYGSRPGCQGVSGDARSTTRCGWRSHSRRTGTRYRRLQGGLADLGPAIAGLVERPAGRTLAR